VEKPAPKNRCHFDRNGLARSAKLRSGETCVPQNICHFDRSGETRIPQNICHFSPERLGAQRKAAQWRNPRLLLQFFAAMLKSKSELRPPGLLPGTHSTLFDGKSGRGSAW
jgi:hypothetical protein